MMTKDELWEILQTWMQASKDHSRDWRQEAKENYDFYAGRQLNDEELAALEEELRPPIVFNRVQPMVSAVSGQEINNRQEVRYTPREMGDVHVNELLTGAAQWVDDECDAEDELSEVFVDLLITGMGWSETRISYEEDLDGKIHSAERFDPGEAYWDHHAKRRNLADAKWRARGLWKDRKEAEAKWPDIKGLDMSDPGQMWPDEDSSQEPHDQARAHFYEDDQSGRWFNRHKDQYFILQVQWWELEPVHRVADPESGQLVEMDPARFKKMKDMFDQAGVKYLEQKKRKYFQAIVIGPKVLEIGDAPCPNAFSLRCVTGKRDATRGMWFGLVRGLKDPQSWSNKFYADIQDMIVSNRQGGAFVEADALQDPRKAEETWNDPNPLITVTPGALAAGKIQERNPIPYPQAMDRMMEWAIQALPATSGISLEMMGFVNRDQPNVLEVQRKRSSLAVLADLFDNMRRFNKERGRVVLYFIQTYIADGRLIRITGQNGKEQYVPLALDPKETKYDVIVDEASSSPNQREETFIILMQILPLLAQMGIAPPPQLLEYLPLPTSLTSKWLAQLMPDQEQPPSEEEQIAMAAATAEIESKRAKAALDQAKAQKEQVDTAAQELENEAVRRGFINPGDDALRELY